MKEESLIEADLEVIPITRRNIRTETLTQGLSTEKEIHIQLLTKERDLHQSLNQEELKIIRQCGRKMKQDMVLNPLQKLKHFQFLDKSRIQIKFSLSREVPVQRNQVQAQLIQRCLLLVR